MAKVLQVAWALLIAWVIGLMLLGQLPDASDVMQTMSCVTCEASKEATFKQQPFLQHLAEFAMTAWAAWLFVLHALMLCLAKYWQAALTGQNDFRQWFLRYRLKPEVLAVALVFAVSLWLPNLPVWMQLNGWLAMALLVLSALPICHAARARWRLGSLWVMGFYLLLFCGSLYVYSALALLVIADSALGWQRDINKN